MKPVFRLLSGLSRLRLVTSRSKEQCFYCGFAGYVLHLKASLKILGVLNKDWKHKMMFFHEVSFYLQFQVEG